MRVLFIQGSSERGGAERVLLWLAKYLPAHGVEPSILFLTGGPFMEEVLDEKIPARNISISTKVRNLWEIPKVIQSLRGEIAQDQAEIVQANGEKMALYSGWASRSAGAASVFWLHDAPLRSLASAFVELGMRLSPHDAVVAGSKWMAHDFRRLLGFKVEAIPHGVDLSEMNAPPTNLKALAGWGPETLVFGHFARLQRWKGQETFLRAAALLANSHSHLRFLIVGGALYGWEQEYADHLPSLAQSLGIGDKTLFAGHRQDALSLMASCSVVVHSSSKPEPLGMVVPEAMGLGRPVIASMTKGPEEVIVHGKTGLLFPPGNIAALSAAMATLADSQAFRASLGAAARESVWKDRSADRMAADFASLYRRLRSS